jgi:hypothetical protein
MIATLLVVTHQITSWRQISLKNWPQEPAIEDDEFFKSETDRPGPFT